MINERLQSVVAWSVIGTALLIMAINFFVTDRTLRNELISTGVGSGLLAIIVGTVLTRLQETSTFEAGKVKAENLFDTKLLLDVREALDQGANTFTLDQGASFYFGSMINDLQDVAASNLEVANNYLAYFPDDSVALKLQQFYVLYRRAIVNCRKLDGILQQTIRQHHHQNGIDIFNDPETRSYIKAKLATDIPESQLLQWHHWTETPERVNEVLGLVENEEAVLRLVSEIKFDRETLTTIVEEIKQGVSERDR